ncbi:MAG: hypothetical protein ACYTXY_45120, partial [Nostoc sp.]
SKTCPHPLTPSPKMGEGKPENLLPSPIFGRGAGGEGKTHTVRSFQLKLTPISFFCAPTAWSIYLEISVNKLQLS